MSHSAHEDELFHDGRKEFQLDRLILFSDAVFAIAITLIIIEIRVPVLDHTSTHALIVALTDKIPEFFSFALSFGVIGQFWITHHRLFGIVTGYTTGLLWLNLHMLFWIVLVPFTSGLNSQYGDMDAVWMIYSFNMTMIAVSLLLLYRYVSSKKHMLSPLAENAEAKRLSTRRSLSVVVIFSLGFILCLPHKQSFSIAARLIYFLIPIALSVIRRKNKKITVKHN